MKKLMLVVVLLIAIVSPAHAGCGKNRMFLYGAYWCSACMSAKQFLASHKVSYQWIEVTGNRRVQKSMLKQFGIVAVPAVVIDGRRRLGFEKGWVKRALCIR